VISTNPGRRVLDEVVIGDTTLRNIGCHADSGSRTAERRPDIDEWKSLTTWILAIIRKVERDAIVCKPQLVGYARREDVCVGEEEVLITILVARDEARKAGAPARWRVLIVKHVATRDLISFTELMIDTHLPLPVEIGVCKKRLRRYQLNVLSGAQLLGEEL
jgi:hypothetical protein